MGYRLSLAVVVAAALFAAAWPLCDQLAGLGVDGSSVAAGVLAIVAFGLTLRLTRPVRSRARHLRSARAEPNGLGWQVGTQLQDLLGERTGPPDGRGHDLPEKPGVTGRPTPHAREIPARGRARTLVTRDIKFIIDDAGMQVRGKRKRAGGETWEEYLRIRWPAVTALGFATGRHDPIVALYAWAGAGKPHHVADSLSLTHLQWTQLSELIVEATSGRLTLDLADRHNPKSIWPDW
jgi:hypothetical protein